MEVRKEPTNFVRWVGQLGENIQVLLLKPQIPLNRRSELPLVQSHQVPRRREEDTLYLDSCEESPLHQIRKLSSLVDSSLPALQLPPLPTRAIPTRTRKMGSSLPRLNQIKFHPYQQESYP